MRTVHKRLCAAAAAVFAVAVPAPAVADPGTPTATPIRHFIYLMQGDRTFDNYFGTYPGADGIPAGACQPLVLGRPRSGCVKPYPLHGSAPQPLEPGRSTVTAQLDGGKLDGFVAAYAAQGRDGTAAMGYYDARDLPFYWAVAGRYELFDRFFGAVPYGYRTNRAYWVAAAPQSGGDQPTIFDRLQAAGISWKFYVQDYQPDQTFRAASATDPATQAVRVPLLDYARFVDDPRLRAHITDLDEYYRDLTDGTLPAVAYVATSGASERSARSVHTGQNLVRTMLTQLTQSPYWPSSAFLWSYDGSGGWYDHVVPPPGFGLRVPALLVSAYAPAGRVDHATLDCTAALRFIERNWHLAPLSARDAHAGDLAAAFDFTAPPRPPEVIPVAATGDDPPPVPTGVIYACYGGALLAVRALLAFAARPARPRPVRVPDEKRREVPVP